MVVNGAEREVAAGTLEAALLELGYGDRRVATALDGDFVPARRRGETTLREGCALEIVGAMAGG